MINEYNPEKETELIGFIHKNFGLEVFTPGLDRTRPLYSRFIDAVNKSGAKITIIGGTNGKGQTAHTLSHLLRSSGKSVALWTSPHILSIRERFNFNGLDVEYSELEFAIFSSFNEIQSEFPGMKISFYEFLFHVFLKLTTDRAFKFEHIILEVGLGGAMDAVNHFEPTCSCITSISRDHQAILGSRLDHILYEKLGISRSGKPLLTNFRSKYLNEKTQEYCRSKNVNLIDIYDTSLGGDYFQENILMAKRLFRQLEGFSSDGNLDDLPLFKGRRERIYFKGNELVFIGAHNIDGIRKMIQTFKKGKELTPDSLLISFSKRETKEIEVMLRSIVDFFNDKSEINITLFSHPKAIDQEMLREVFSSDSENFTKNVNLNSSWKSFLSENQKKRIIVCGSYYFIGEVQKYIVSQVQKSTSNALI